MTVILTHCLNKNCAVALALPDAEHRYCPRCGAVRVISEPPERPDSPKLLKVGYEAFGERSRKFYSHSSLAQVPTKCEPFSSFPNSNRPLFPSSWVTGALHSVESSPIIRDVSEEFGEGISSVVVAHGRCWVLFYNGVLQAYSCQTLERITSFEKEEWYEGDEQVLSLSGSFLYSVNRRPNGWTLRTIDAASGETVPPALPLDLEHPKVFFEGVEGAVLGRDGSERFIVRRLCATTMGTTIFDPISLKVSSKEPQGETWWGGLGNQTFLLCPDGVVRRWEPEDSRFETIWGNESRAWVGRPHRYKEELLFPLATKSELRLLRVGSQASCREQELCTWSRGTRRFSTCGVNDVFYFLSQDQQLMWHLERVHLPTGERWNSQVLAGSSDLTEIELQSAAVQGVPYVLVSGRSTTKWTFWGWNIKEQKFHHQLAGHPHADERISFHWEGANTWMVRHSQRGKGGRICCLPVT